MKANFSGYVTKAGLKCSDGRTITPEAFKHMDGMKVPLVWQHQRKDPSNVLGHVLLEARPDGMYGYGFFNDTKTAINSKELVEHEDITSMSIYANQLVEKTKQVLHGMIREVSLVVAGANPGALIDYVSVEHSDGEISELDDEATIYTGLPLEHADAPADKTDDGPTVQDIIDTMTPEQKDVMAYMVGEALAAKHSDDDSDDSEDATDDTEDDTTDDDSSDDGIDHQEGSEMKHNVFEENGASAQERPSLTHDQLTTLVADAKRMGSFKEAFLTHATEYGVENIDLLFPDAKTVDGRPEWVSRRMEWVNSVLTGTKKNPFSRIKTISADITFDEARAKGYVKGSLKKEEWFGLTQRITTPTTIYKKQKLDRDDMIDITDLDVVAWLKAEMRVMLDEEIARATLVGDGREVDDEDKISETNIRPIAYDDDFYAHKVTVASGVAGDALIDAIVTARQFYRGSGNPTMYTTEALLTSLLLIKDLQGRRLYPTETELAAAMRVSNIVAVPILEGRTTPNGELLAILVNLSDYTHGADQGGQVSMFDDFDIDYNQFKYLIEGRLSGCLTKFKTALVVSRTPATGTATPNAPTFNTTTGVLTIVATTGVVYTNAVTGATLSTGAQSAIAAGASVRVHAGPAAGYVIANNAQDDWLFTRDS